MRAERTDEQIGRNDAYFREMNEQIVDAAQRFGASAERLPFLCECAEETCTAIVRLTLEEYEAVRSVSTHFLNAPGHDVEDGSAVAVIERFPAYTLVAKIGRAAEIADDSDPRS